MVVRERATIYVRVDGVKWRLYDEEGVTQGKFNSLESAMTAARYLARDHAPCVIKGQDENGEWRVTETYLEPEQVDVAASPADDPDAGRRVEVRAGRRRRKWLG